ncbi:hypothetical protein [Spirosoma areae]
MDSTNSDAPFEDGQSFVIEACGDSMWDEVLAQPAYDPLLRPPVTPETAQQNVQMADDARNSNDLPTQPNERQLGSTETNNL